jgi:hypothetical protein
MRVNVENNFKAVLFNDTSVEDHHGCAIVVSQLLQGCRAQGIEVVRRVPLGLRCETQAELQWWLAGMDLCLINGEGTLHDDAPVALALGEVARYCHAQGIPCFLVNSVWQNNVRLNQYLPCFTAVYFRDEASAAAAAPYRDQVAVVPDLTLLTDFGTSAAGARSGRLLNGSVLGAQLQALMALAYPAPPTGSTYLSIRCLPGLVGGTRESLRFSLRQATKAFRHWLQARCLPLALSPAAKRASRWRWRHARLSRRAFLVRIASAQSVVTGRYHMVTLCLASRTPFVAVASNTGKIQALLEDVGVEGRVFDGFADAFRLGNVPSFTDEELRAIDGYLKSARARAGRMFAEIAGYMAARR